MTAHVLYYKDLGLVPYLPIWQKMQSFTQNRTAETPDQIWFLQHEPVFTQGQNGKPEHLLAPKEIPVVQVDRGGQITYHGPGQLVVYLLIDIKRQNFGIRHLVTTIEESVIQYLASLNIPAQARKDAPGVYIGDMKIASLGLRVKRGCSYHGLAFNIHMDLEPFSRINPCGLTNIKMTQVNDFTNNWDFEQIKQQLLSYYCKYLGYDKIKRLTTIHNE
ncbi:MAG: octanoyltransferase [Legionellales bacterium]|nr:octanoyltransferase [Legionellales bacterium]